MTDITADFKASYLALAKQPSAAQADLGNHLSPQQLTDFCQGDLPAAQRQRLNDHLLQCEECFAIWRERRSFAAAPASERSRFEIALLLRNIRRYRRPFGSFSPRRLYPLALAASIMSVAFLSGLLALRQRTIDDLSSLARPCANPSIIELAEGPGSRGSSRDQPLAVKAEAGFLFLFTPRQVREYPEYQVRILDSEGTPVHTVRGLESNPYDDTFSLWLPPGALATGEYRVKLETGNGELVEEHHLLVAGQDG